MVPVSPLLVSSAKACKVGFKRVLDSHQVQLIAIDIQAALRDLRPVGEGLLHQLIHRRGIVLGRNRDGVERNNMRIHQAAVRDSIAADGVLQHGFLLQQIGLRHQQVLLADINLRLGARHFNGRQRARLRLFSVVFQKLFGGREFPLPGAHVLPELHQIPIQVENRRHRGSHLRSELQIGHLDIVLLHADIAPVHRRSETVQQILGDLQIQIARGVGIDAEERAVHVGVLVVVSELGAHAEVPALVVTALESCGSPGSGRWFPSEWCCFAGWWYGQGFR